MSKEQVEMLKSVIHSMGMTVKGTAKRIGMNNTTFHRKLNGTSEFTLPEIRALRKVLELSAEEFYKIFFA